MSVHICITSLRLLALWLLGDAGAIGHQQVHHCVAADEHGGRGGHAAQGHGASCCSIRTAADRHWFAHGRVVGAHVALQLRGGFAMDAAELTDQNASGAG